MSPPPPCGKLADHEALPSRTRSVHRVVPDFQVLPALHSPTLAICIAIIALIWCLECFSNHTPTPFPGDPSFPGDTFIEAAHIYMPPCPVPPCPEH